MPCIKKKKEGIQDRPILFFSISVGIERQKYGVRRREGLWVCMDTYQLGDSIKKKVECLTRLSGDVGRYRGSLTSHRFSELQKKKYIKGN